MPKLADKPSVICQLCRQACRLRSGEVGFCGVRQAQTGPNALEPDGLEIVSLVRDNIAACNVDPVEKKPLYHFLPGSRIFSFGTMGCNLDCAWCQNDSIARFPAEQGRIRGTRASAQNLVDQAVADNCRSLAFTYTEPTVFYELMTETAALALQNGLKTVMVSNGYQSAQALRDLLPLISAANIDLKSFSDQTYRDYCHGRLRPVLDNLKTLAAAPTWLEVTTLVIPGLNDSTEELRSIAQFISTELGLDVPWHISAFHPSRKLRHLPSTPLASLSKARELGIDAGLRYVYMGNVGAANNTLCPGCGQTLIKRQGYGIEIADNFDGTCPACNLQIPGCWS